MKKKNGFTLVELLAVIVVLAIIMIIAIPAVLEVMNRARKSSFVLYVEKIVNNVQTQYMYDANAGSIQGAGYYVYDITTDLKLNGTGAYRGFVVVNATNVDNVEYIVSLYDNNYQLLNYNISNSGMPTVDTPTLVGYNSSQVDEIARTSVRACRTAAGTTSVECYNRNGYIIQESAS